MESLFREQGEEGLQGPLGDGEMEERKVLDPVQVWWFRADHDVQRQVAREIS